MPVLVVINTQGVYIIDNIQCVSILNSNWKSVQQWTVAYK